MDIDQNNTLKNSNKIQSIEKEFYKYVEKVIQLDCVFEDYYLYLPNNFTEVDIIGTKDQITAILGLIKTMKLLNNYNSPLPIKLKVINNKLIGGSKREIELQEKFMNVVEEMIKENVELPDKFELFYRIMNHSDRQGRVLQIKPFLTQLSATNDCKKDNIDNSGKYWSECCYTVEDSNNYVYLENYSTGNRECKHQIDIELAQ